jgi:DME family drug/metabolite transporter
VGIALVIFAAALWATVGIAVKLVPSADRLSPHTLGLVRTLLAGPLVLLAAGHHLGRLGPVARTCDRRQLLTFAIAGVVFQIALFRCFELLDVTLTVVLTVCLPPVIAVLWSLARGVGFRRDTLAAMALSISGLGLCAFARGIGEFEDNRVKGLILAVVASVAFVLMTSAARSLSRDAPPILIAGLGLGLSGLIFCAILPLVPGASVSEILLLARDPGLVLLVIYLAAFPTALAYVCYCAGMARCSSTAGGLTASMIEPAIAASLAFWLLQAIPSRGEILGSALLILGIVILAKAEMVGQMRGKLSGNASSFG